MPVAKVNHGTMSISCDVTPCAKLKCIVSCLNFYTLVLRTLLLTGWEYLIIDIKQAMNTI